ncbi:MAG: hypothetical protein KatS3mg031_2893 [Chitinophagales bacterium]|nr:MAG: hypothetical protein KatS3mg031_2893 [Chitinophagales bacterium]
MENVFDFEFFDRGEPTDKWLVFLGNYAPAHAGELLEFYRDVLPKGFLGDIVVAGENGEYTVCIHTHKKLTNEALVRTILLNHRLFRPFMPARLHIALHSEGIYIIKITANGT